jgi:toxin CptA
MRWPPPVRVVLSPSTSALALIVSLALATCGVVASLPVEAAASGLAWLAIGVWTIDRVLVVALRRGPRAVRALELRGDLTVLVVTGDGRVCAGRVHRDSYVGARLSTLVWRPYGRWRVRAILLLPDMLPVDDFRRLRVLLRYGRSDVTQGDPASHA